MGTMKRLLLGLALAAFSVALIPSTASAATNTGFVGCDDTTENPQPSHKCLTTDSPAAYFEASEEIEYEVCLFRGPVEEECSPPATAEAETLFQNSFKTSAGTYDAVWFVAGTEEELAEWEIAIEEPPPPPPPVLPVAPPVVAPVLPTLNTECLAAQKRVTRLKGRVRRAHGEQKAKLKSKLRKARAAANAACG
jgi:hypothetical protein